MISPAVSSTACPQCGSANKSGKRSCCARGGAWFQNCGDTGDTQFDHTWTEGIQACEGRLQKALVCVLYCSVYRIVEISFLQAIIHAIVTIQPERQLHWV